MPFVCDVKGIKVINLKEFNTEKSTKTTFLERKRPRTYADFSMKNGKANMLVEVSSLGKLEYTKTPKFFGSK